MRFAVLCAALLLPGCQQPGGATPSDGGAADLPPHPPHDLLDPLRTGWLFLDVTDDATLHSLPARVLVTAVPPTPRPCFDCDGDLPPTGGATATYPAAYTIGEPGGLLLITGSALIPFAEGTYDLFITHGPEWEADQRRVTVTPRDTTVVLSALRHSVDTNGWMAADLHVHTSRSYDSHLQFDARVVSEVTVGVELIVSTDHNGLTDLGPDVEQLGYGDIARAIVGDEFNFFEGHGGAYPMPYDGSSPDQGISALKLDWDVARNVHSGDMFDFLHRLPIHPAVTVNHPRLLPDLGYFTNLMWAPPMPLPDAGRFDGLEVLNGYSQDPAQLAELLRDWFFLLTSGTKVTALGSSDTHRLRDIHAGFPRSWLRMPSSDVRALSDSDLADAVRAGRALASNGPFALLTVDGKAVGETASNATGQALCDVTVDAPGWIDVDHLRLFVNGRLAAERAIAPGSRPRFHDVLPVPLPGGDAWVVLQVGGARALRPDVIGEHGAGHVMPFAITNPVYIDGDGDGTWKPALARPTDADPGPIGPLGRQPRPPAPCIEFPPGRAHPAPIDCEPPLSTDPATWVPR